MLLSAVLPCLSLSHTHYPFGTLPKLCLSINRCAYLPALFNSGIRNNQCSAIICGNLSFLSLPLSHLPCMPLSQFRFRFFRTHYTLFCFASTRIASYDEYSCCNPWRTAAHCSNWSMSRFANSATAADRKRHGMPHVADMCAANCPSHL